MSVREDNETARKIGQEFTKTLMVDGGTRPVMSRPPRVYATSKFIRQVKDGLNITDDDQAREAADWIIDKMERFGASTARGVFDLEGNGPQCSWCSAMWPLCGHQHLSSVEYPEDEAENGATHE